MEKQVVQKRWKLIFWGLTAAAVALLAPGLVLTLEPALFLGLGVLAAVVFCTGLCIAVIKLRCPACGGSVYHQAMRAQEGIPFARRMAAELSVLPAWYAEQGGTVWLDSALRMKTMERQSFLPLSVNWKE